MSSSKSKTAVNSKIDDEVNRLKRQPLYPDLREEKENIESYSSGDSQANYPKLRRKNNSPSNTDSMPTTPRSPKRKNKRHQQNQMKNFQDSENFEEDMETDDLEDPENYPDLSLESDRCKNSQDARSLTQSAVHPQRTEPLASTSNSSILLSYVCLLMCIIAILISIFCKVYLSPSTLSTSNKFNASTMVSSLKAEFKNQPPLTFRIINLALRNVLEGQPTAPAIILLLATNGSETVCNEFAHKLVHLLSVPNYTINGKDFKQANTNHVKKEIDEAISNKLEDDQLGSVLIHDLDQIPGQAAMIFHKYYDHENAPFKKAVFVMTVNYNKAIDDYSSTKVWDKAANDHLLSVWTDIGVDQVTPLLARLTVSVVVIKA